MDNTQNQQQQEPTFGMRLVGISFNPSGDEKVARIKSLCAELADIVNDDVMQNEERTALQVKLLDHAIYEILNAQMNAVKVVTLKY